MIIHFFKIATRNIKRKSTMSFLNIAGLSLGIASFLVISLYVFQENTFEKGFENNERVYRLEEHFLSMGQVAVTSPNLQFKLNEIPEIEAATRVHLNVSETVLLDGRGIKVNRTLRAKNDFFELFDYKLLMGNQASPLNGPGAAVISEALAETIFGRKNVIGESLKLKGKDELIISAVASTPLVKSHLDFDLLVYPEKEEEFSAESGWYGIAGYTYVRLAPNVAMVTLNTKLDELAKTHVFPVVFKPSPDMSFEDWIVNENRIQFIAKPIEDIYLHSNLSFEMSAGGDPQMLTTLSIIAVFILTIAIINFMNLTTARSSSRTKEIGVRKVLGSKREGLVLQFLAESLLITLLSALIGAGLSEVMIYGINAYFGSVIGLSLFSNTTLLAYIGLGVLLVGLVAGLYPAFYLSSVKVVPLLKGMRLSKVLNLNVAKLLRNGLVITQFTLIATLFIYSQLVHLKNKDLGFAENQILVISNAQDLKDGKQAFKNELLKTPGVKSASFSKRVPGGNFDDVHSIMLDANNTVVFAAFTVDEDYKTTLGLKMREGDWFRDELVTSDSLVLINNAAAQLLGLEHPVGEKIGNYYRIVGVVEDFHYGSLRNEIGPALFNYSATAGGQLAIQLDVNKVPTEAIANIWSRFTAVPLESKMLEQNFDTQFQKETQSANSVLAFTLLAILISCIGLFGLAAFTADQRLHEFGIRKVLGASVSDIVSTFSFDFLKLIGIAFLISIPLAIWGVNAWLQSFADRISLSAGAFILAGILALMIAFSTILFQSLKAGRLNPVDTLRNE